MGSVRNGAAGNRDRGVLVAKSNRHAARAVVIKIIRALYPLLVIGLIASGCSRDTRLTLHYLPGIVPNTEHVLSAEDIAVLPVTGHYAAGTLRVGGIYNADGSPRSSLYVEDAGASIRSALI